MAGNRVEPGTTAEVVVEFKTRYLDADVTSELLTRVVTDDRALPELALTIKIAVQPEYLMSHPSVDLGDTPLGHRVQHLLTLDSLSGQRFRILDVRSSDDVVEVSIGRKKSDSPNTHRIVVAQKESAPLGSHFGNLVITTSSEVNPEIRIPIRGRVVSKQ